MGPPKVRVAKMLKPSPKDKSFFSVHSHLKSGKNNPQVDRWSEKLQGFLFNPVLWLCVGFFLFLLAISNPRCEGDSCGVSVNSSNMVPPLQSQSAVLPQEYSRSLSAGYVSEKGSEKGNEKGSQKGNMSSSVLGNGEGFQPGKVVNYSTPLDIVEEKVMVASLWKNEPESLVHVGSGLGLVMAGFSESSVDLLASFSSNGKPANASGEVLVFFDGRFADASLWGSDVMVKNGKPTMMVSSLRTYQVLKDVPKGKHLLVLATQSDGFGFQRMLFGKLVTINHD